MHVKIITEVGIFYSIPYFILKMEKKDGKMLNDII